MRSALLSGIYEYTGSELSQKTDYETTILVFGMEVVGNLLVNFT